MCTKGALNSSTATLEEASNKCYFHAKLFLFCATRLICVRGLFSSVMPRAIFHLTEEAKSRARCNGDAAAIRYITITKADFPQFNPKTMNVFDTNETKL